MILQRDKRIIQPIRKYGCYLFSILFLCNKYKNVELSAEDINDLYDVFIIDKYIDKNCFIHDPQAIFHFMGFEVYFYDRHDPPDYICEKDEIEILRFQYGKWKHFVTGDGMSHVVFDPMGCSRAVEYGILMDKRIFHIER